MLRRPFFVWAGVLLGSVVRAGVLLGPFVVGPCSLGRFVGAGVLSGPLCVDPFCLARGFVGRPSPTLRLYSSYS